MIELRLPKLTGSDHEQLMQLKSFLYQHIEQLQWALNMLDQKIDNNTKEQDDDKKKKSV